MTFLPPLGSTYPSLAHFKFDVYTRAANACQSFDEMEDHPDLFCRLVCSDLGSKSHGVVGSCSSSIFCGRIGESYEVISREEAHTCEGWESSKDPFRTKIKMLFKVNAQVQAISALSATLGQEDEGGVRSEELQEDIRGKFEEINKKGEERLAQVNGKGFISRGVQTMGAVAIEPSSKKSHIQDEPFPRIASLNKRINGLTSTPLSLPAAHETFSTLEEILSRVHAFAQSQGVVLEHSVATSTATTKHLICSHNHQEYKHVRGGRCPVDYRISQTQSGKWSLSYPTASHSHPVFETVSIPPVVSEVLKTVRIDPLRLSSRVSNPSNSPRHPNFRSSASRLPSKWPVTQIAALPSRSKDSQKPLLPTPLPRNPSLPYPSRSTSSSSSFKFPSPSPTHSPVTSKRKAEDSISPASPNKVSRISPPDTELKPVVSDSVHCHAGREGKEEEVSILQANNFTSSSVDSKESSIDSISAFSRSGLSTSSSLNVISPTPPLFDPMTVSQNNFSSFLRSFNFDRISSTVSSLRHQGIQSLNCLADVLSIVHQPRFARFVEGFEGEETKRLLYEMRRSLREFEKQN